MRRASTFLVVGTAGLALVVAAIPAGYRVERTVRVAAPAAAILAQLEDLTRWTAWSPEEAKDPRIARTYAGRPGVPGMTSYWSGNREVGRGRLTVVAVAPGRLDLELEQEEPRAAVADVELRLQEEDGGTRVTWAVAGENGPVDRVIWLAGGGADTLGRSLEARLALLRAATEVIPRPPPHRLGTSAVVAAAPETVRARISDLRGWPAWTPWGGPRSAVVASEAPGAGQSVYWVDETSAGQGRMTILSDGPQGVDVELEVTSGTGAAVANDLEFRITPSAGGTRVTWTVIGDGGIPGAVLERALGRLRSLVEGRLP